MLSGSFEFDKFHNDEIVERPSDDEEVLMVNEDDHVIDEGDDDADGCSNILLTKMFRLTRYRIW